MNYDRTAIPQSYDAGRERSGSVKKAMLAFFAEHQPSEDVAMIVDLGCGTGRFSQTLSETFDARVVAVDPSEKMLAQAKAKSKDPRIAFQLGSGEALPLADGTVDLVFLSMVLHHLPQPERTARECRRVLRQGGAVCIRNTMADEISSYPYLDVFPSIRGIIEARLISRDRADQLFAAAGLRLLARSVVPHQMAADWSSYVEKVALKADSFVARLPGAEFEAGLRALRAQADGLTQDGPVTLNLDQFIYCCT